MEKRKVLGKIKLNQLKKSELEQRELNAIKGGICADCACTNYYPYTGGGNSSSGTVPNY